MIPSAWSWARPTFPIEVGKEEVLAASSRWFFEDFRSGLWLDRFCCLDLGAPIVIQRWQAAIIDEATAAAWQTFKEALYFENYRPVVVKLPPPNPTLLALGLTARF